MTARRASPLAWGLCSLTVALFTARLGLVTFEPSSKLRDEIDLDSLGGELRSVVGETMQPVHMSLWLQAGR